MDGNGTSWFNSEKAPLWVIALIVAVNTTLQGFQRSQTDRVDRVIEKMATMATSESLSRVEEKIDRLLLHLLPKDKHPPKAQP